MSKTETSLRGGALVLAMSALVLSMSAAQAAEQAAPAAPVITDDLMSALQKGTFWVDARYRYEMVHQANLAREAQANTLRTILGYDSGVFKGFKVQLAGMNNTHITNDTYNDGRNGRTNYPGITDPEDTQLYLANLTYSGVQDTAVTVGRQRIVFDNSRFVGSSQWRQVAASYDGLMVKNTSLPDTEVAYGFVFHQNRSAGTRSTTGTYDASTHLFHATYSGIKDIKLTGYTYLLDYETQRSLSSATYGGRVEGKKKLVDAIGVSGVAEYARQTDNANNPTRYALNYYRLEPGLFFGKFKAAYVSEYLGGDGRAAVQTPMMSSHSMNGWADQFQTIPNNGLRDDYVDVSYGFKLPVPELGETQIAAQWHDYNSTRLGQHYGNEWGLDFVQNIGDHYAVGVQYANYITDTYLRDTQKVIVTGQVKF